MSLLLTCLIVLVQASVCLVYFCLEGFDLLLSWGQEISRPPRIRVEGEKEVFGVGAKKLFSSFSGSLPSARCF